MLNAIETAAATGQRQTLGWSGEKRPRRASRERAAGGTASFPRR